MSISWRFALALGGGILLVHMSFGYVRFHREKNVFQDGAAQDQKVLGRSLALAARRIWTTSGQDPAMDFVAHADHAESQVQIRWVWLAAQPGDPLAPAATTQALEPVRGGKQIILQLSEPVPSIYAYSPINMPSTRAAAIEIADPTYNERAYILTSLRNVTLSTLSLLAFCVLIAWLLGGHLISRPVDVLVNHARKLGGGDLSARLALRRTDEIGQLASELNSMAQSLETARDRVDRETRNRVTAVEQLRHADRLGAIGTLASGVAHELGTPLNVVEGHAELIREDAGAGQAAQENALIIIKQAKRMTSIIRQLLDFSRRGEPSRVSTDLVDLCKTSLAMVESFARKNDVVTKLLTAEDGRARAVVTAPEIQQVLTNLLINAVHAMPKGGTLRLCIRRERRTSLGNDRTERDFVIIWVEDTGTGMSDEVRSHLFEPFFTTKEVGDGTGLGLAVAHGIVRDHGGWIEVETQEGKGSSFAVYLPEEQPS